MPWTEMSPLAAALGAASGYYQGKQQKEQTEYDRSKQAKQDALAAATTNANLAATYAGTTEQQQQTAEEAATYKRAQELVGKNYGFDPKRFSKMTNPGERTQYIQTAQARAIAAGDTVKASELGQMATAVPLGTERISQGGYFGARANYEQSRIGYDQQILQYKYKALNQAQQLAVQKMANGLSIAEIRRATGSSSASNDTKLAIAALMYERSQGSSDATTARQQALDEYNHQWTAYIANEKGISAGNDPIPGAPTTAPTMPTINVNSGGGSNDAIFNALIQKVFGGGAPPPAPPKPVATPTSGEGQPAPPGSKPGQSFKYKDGKTYTVGKDGKMHLQTSMGWGNI